MTEKDRVLIGRAAELLRPLLRQARTAVLCTHVGPDGDGVGAEICLHQYLRMLGVDARILNADPLPERYRFLDPDGEVAIFSEEEHGALVRNADLIFVLDNSAVDRLGPLEKAVRASRATTICIDHHNVVDPFWKVNIVDQEACATGELVFQIVKALGGRLNLPAAQAAYVSMVTDTGNFRFSKTSARCHEAAAELLGVGVSPQQVYEEVFERNSPELIRLGGVALAGLRIGSGGRLAWITLSRDQILACGADSEDTSDVVNWLLAIDGVRVAVLFKELENGRVKVSLRSKGALDVNRLAAGFGGGGHSNASGTVIEATLQGAIDTILTACRELIERSP
ncbi:MAG: bifunctional oligoribonuclease/PAP phosphatase NrnA [Acidobacteriota bacterium]